MNEDEMERRIAFYKQCREEEKRRQEEYNKAHNIKLTIQEEVQYDNPNSMSRGAGILWYILIMVGGTIFKDKLLIWIAATLIFVPWINKKLKFKKVENKK